MSEEPIVQMHLRHLTVFVDPKRSYELKYTQNHNRIFTHAEIRYTDTRTPLTEGTPTEGK